VHSISLPSGSFAQHSGDYSGNIRFHVAPDEVEVDTEVGIAGIYIPFEDIKAVVAEWIRSVRIDQLDQASTMALLHWGVGP
jgi:hypothetical protein